MKPKRCPKCKTLTGIPIVYGYPDKSLIDAEEKGEVVIGGCCHDENDPEYECIICKHQWEGK